MRQWVTPRSLLLHAAFLAIAAGCLMAGWWQVHRAMQGNTLSYLYSVEWPAFVVVAGIGWWQMFHDTPDDLEQRRRFRADMRAASAEVVARSLPRSALAIQADSRETGGRALPAGVAPAQLASGQADEDRPAAALVVRDAGLLPADPNGPASGDSDEMTEYNRYLALLAVKGKAKTWRNPRGL